MLLPLILLTKGLLGKASSLIPTRAMVYLGVAALVLVASFVYGEFRYKEGERDADTKWQLVAAAEAARQAEINRKAQEEIASKTADYLEALRRVDELLEENSVEAQKDTRAGAPSLSSGSVRRLDAIR